MNEVDIVNPGASGIIGFIMSNQADVMAIIGSAMVIGGIIVKLTPTKTDDIWWTKLKAMVTQFIPTKTK